MDEVLSKIDIVHQNFPEFTQLKLHGSTFFPELPKYQPRCKDKTLHVRIINTKGKKTHCQIQQILRAQPM